MTKSTRWSLILSLLLAAYVCVALPLTASMERNSLYPKVSVSVEGGSNGFVTDKDIIREMHLDTLLRNSRKGDINLLSLREKLLQMPQIEDAKVYTGSDGGLYIDVKPLKPVARFFTPAGSFYINSSGKRVRADMKYHIDVPVVTGEIGSDKSLRPQDLLPLLRYIASDEHLDALVSSLEVDRRGNIFIHPVIRGHVVNFGDTSAVADKFNRLLTFYRKVMPLKGWEHYDTIAVKWRGQVVAKLNTAHKPKAAMPVEDTEYDLIDDIETMSIDGVEPGPDNDSTQQKPIKN